MRVESYIATTIFLLCYVEPRFTRLLELLAAGGQSDAVAFTSTVDLRHESALVAMATYASF